MSFAERTSHVRALLVVGSWARGTPTPTSDLDIIILTSTPERLTGDDAWLCEFDGEIIRRKTWGVVEERRLRLRTGLILELGVARLDWAATDPVDEGTAAVAGAGSIPLYDPDGLLRHLLAVLHVTAPRPAWLPDREHPS